ncbi:MAG TPA: hypothetical protein VF407_23975, partial [Polyangiaceae bacterium]
MRHFFLVGAIAAASLVGSFAACGSSDDGSQFGNDAGGDGALLGDGGSDPFLDGLTSMDIAPANAVVEATPTKAGTQTFTVTGHFSNGLDKDITSHTNMALGNPDVGTLAAGAFTSSTGHGGKTTLNASAGSVVASTSVTVHFTATTNGPDNGTPLPADPSKSFAGTADSSRAPKLAYPNDKTMFPPNVSLLDVHWERGPAANTLYEISFEGPTIDLKTYLRCTKPATGQPQPINDGCIYAL